MYDYGISILEQYALTAKSSSRIRGALLCHTEKGPVIIREFRGSEKKLIKQQELLNAVEQKGYRVDSYLLNEDGGLVSRDRDNIPYTVQRWYEGRECDTRSREDILKGVRTLANIHKEMKLPVVEYYKEPDLRDEYRRHNQEMKKSVNLSAGNLLPALLKRNSFSVWRVFWKKGRKPWRCCQVPDMKN